MVLWVDISFKNLNLIWKQEVMNSKLSSVIDILRPRRPQTSFPNQPIQNLWYITMISFSFFQRLPYYKDCKHLWSDLRIKLKKKKSIKLLLAVKEFIIKNWILEDNLKERKSKHYSKSHSLNDAIGFEAEVLALQSHDEALCHTLYYPHLILAGLEKAESREKFSRLFIKQMSECSRVSLKREARRGAGRSRFCETNISL